jgi:AraC-like DNA-binding protein
MKMNLNDIAPFVRQVLITKLRPSLYTGKKIKTLDCRLFYIIRGSGEMIIEGKHYPIKAGSLILFQMGTEYVWQIKDMSYIVINFDYTQEFSHIKRTFSPINSDLFPKNSFSNKIDFVDTPELNSEIVFSAFPTIESKITNLAVEINTSTDFKDELLSSMLKSIIISIVRQNRERQPSGNNKNALLVRQIIEFIQENYNKPIKSEDLSEHFFFNSSYLNRVFKAHTGFNIRTFIIDYRINQAMEILRTQNISVSEVAFLVGFSDVPHFIKTFKSCVGKTPIQYRNDNTFI